MNDTLSQPLTFSTWLKRQRRLLDLTRDELGRRAHCSPETIKKIESDERLPSKELAGLMADALAVPAEQREAFVQFARNTSTAFLQEPVLSILPAHTQAEPALPLLHTKLFKPVVRPNLVLRPRLIALLKTGLTCPLTLIASSAGFGKTTLAAHITTFNELAGTAWLSLDGDDNDPTCFLTYFIHACQRLQPGVGEMGLASLRAPQAPSPKNTLAALANEMARASAPPQPMGLVLDDYHVITAPTIHEAVAYFIENLPPQLHIVLVSRADPPLPLARWRAHNLMTEIRAEALRFTHPEVAAFFSQTSGLALQAEQVAALEARTEGWIAGLQLAALSMQSTQSRPDQAEFIAAFSGSNRFVLDYLMDEVLSRQPKAAQDFLLQTSILSQLSGDLCDALTQQAGGQTTLEQLERSNLFVIALDHNRQWYRYHHLFADVLQSRLKHTQPAQVAVLHQRASDWFAQHAHPIEAIQHALAAQNFDQAASLLETHALGLLLNGNAARVRDWLAILPSHLEPQRPRLILARAWMLLGNGIVQHIEGLLHQAEALLQDSTTLASDDIHGEMAALRAIAHDAFHGPQTLVFARRALALLPAHSPVRSLAYISMGNAHYNAGELAEAHHIFAQMLARVSPHRALVTEQVALRSSLGMVLLAQGHLTEAHSFCAKAIEQAGNEGEVLANGASLSLSRLGVIAYYRNGVDEAEQRLTRALVLAQQHQGIESEIYAASNLAQVLRVRKQWGRALMLTEQAYALTPAHAQLVRNSLGALRANIQLEQGDLAAAAEWATHMDETFERPRMTPLDQDRFVRARVWMAQTQWGKAQAALLQLQQDAEATGHGVFLLQADIMLAVIRAAQDKLVDAFAELERALSLAEPEGFVRLFLDEGKPMQRLLSEFCSQTHLPEHKPFAESVLGHFVSSGT